MLAVEGPDPAPRVGCGARARLAGRENVNDVTALERAVAAHDAQAAVPASGSARVLGIDDERKAVAS